MRIYKIIVLTLTLLLATTYVYACIEAQVYAKENKVECYVAGFGSCTAMYCGDDYYDKDGNYVRVSDCNTCTYGYECSDGHSGTCET